MGNRLYVGNLSFDATEESVREAFEAYGAVTEVKIITDRMTGRPRGFAFVTMATNEDAGKAREKMNGASLGGRTLRVDEASPRPEREGGRGGFRGDRDGRR
jgi:cold-inducible RNA-binding protein